MGTCKLVNGTISNGRLGTFSPLLYSPGMWLDAMDHSTLRPFLNETDNISRWNDKSVNAYYMSQVTPVDQGVYLPTGFNGKPTTSWVAANTTYLNRDMAGTFISNPALSGAVSLFIVFNVPSFAGIKFLLDSGTGANLIGIGITSQSNGRVTIQTASDSFVSSGSQWSTATDTYLSVIWDGSSIKIWNNGIFKQSNGSFVNSGVDNRTNFNIGTGSIPGAYLDSVISELIIYPTALTTVQRLNIEYYLATKWDI